MGIDALFKRYFPIFVCLFIGVAAYLQASGITQLVASSVALDPSALPAPAPRPGPAHAASAATNPDHVTSNEAILARNPFDSVTGPLNATEPTLPSAAAVEDSNRDPYTDPPCDSAKVLLIAASDDPQWSFASIVGSDGKPILRRQGDEVGSLKVEFIGDRRPSDRRKADHFGLYDRVWMTSTNGSRCQAEVGGKVTKVAAAPAASGSSAPPPGGRGQSPVVKEIASRIRKTGETEYSVDRSAIDLILENQGELMKSVRVSPEKEGDKVVGLRLFGIRPDSLVATLGLENGDRLSSINGFELSDPQKALEAYAKLRTADRLTVAVNRKGKPTNIDFNIK